MTDNTSKMGSQGQTLADLTETTQETAENVTTPSTRRSPVAEKGLNVDIPADLHRDLKLITTFNGITVKQAVTTELQRYVKKEIKKMMETIKDKY